MKRFRLAALIAVPILSLALVVADIRIRASNAQRNRTARMSLIGTGQQINWSLEDVRDTGSKNPASSKASLALIQKYAKAEQSYSGIQAFKTTFLKAKPKIIGPLVGQSRTAMSAHLWTLTISLDSHADMLRQREEVRLNSSGGLIATLQRKFAPFSDSTVFLPSISP